MQTIESLKNKINTAEQLHSITRTMKALAAANIQNYQKAVHSLANYDKNIQLGLQALIGRQLISIKTSNKKERDALGIIVFGSEQGMCGPLNNRILQYMKNLLNEEGAQFESTFIIGLGHRIINFLKYDMHRLSGRHNLPSSLGGIPTLVEKVLLDIDRWREQKKIEHIWLLYSEIGSKSSYDPVRKVLLPIKEEKLHELKQKRWPTHQIPLITMQEKELFSALIREHLYMSLFRATAESLASENAGRLAAMNSAQRNIDIKLEELQLIYKRTRQSNITEELLDITTGQRAIKNKSDQNHPHS